MPKTNWLTAEEFKLAASAGDVAEDIGLRKGFVAEVKVESDTRRELSFTVSTSSIDRAGDTIAVDGWQLDAYRKNPVVLWAHDYTGAPIAKSNHIGPEGTKLRSVAEFVPASISRFADSVYQLYKLGFMSATSIGMIPLKWAFTEDKERKFGIDFTRQELLEYSAVPVPANAEALIEARSMGIDTEPLRKWAAQFMKDAAGAAELKTIRDFENFLRDVGGFSRKEAAAIASRGWNQRDADPSEAVKSALEGVRARLFQKIN